MSNSSMVLRSLLSPPLLLPLPFPSPLPAPAPAQMAKGLSARSLSTAQHSTAQHSTAQLSVGSFVRIVCLFRRCDRCAAPCAQRPKQCTRARERTHKHARALTRTRTRTCEHPQLLAHARSLTHRSRARAHICSHIHAHGPEAEGLPPSQASLLQTEV